jgi:hypothetical protein
MVLDCLVTRLLVHCETVVELRHWTDGIAVFLGTCRAFGL